jgi:hypothetical protein
MILRKFWKFLELYKKEKFREHLNENEFKHVQGFVELVAYGSNFSLTM